jgi:two-component system, cell cycle response regulator
MDAKANTHICVSPVSHPGAETTLSEPHAAYLIMVRGGIPGTMLRLQEHGTTLGRSAENAFQLIDLTVSRRHAFLSVDPAGRLTITDEGSTNGTFVNGQRIPAHEPARLGDGDRIQLGRTVILKLVQLDPADERFQREMFERSVRDSLTGLYNRSFFLNQVRALSERNQAHGLGLAVLMLDIDHFKRINDRYGHVAGDGVLREVAARIREATRAEDLVARYGGEEFVIALPVSAPDLATDRAERIRSSIAGQRVMAAAAEIRVTASLGLAFAQPGRWRNESSLIMAADQALYQAKTDGRNRVVFGQSAMSLSEKATESAEFSCAGALPE